MASSARVAGPQPLWFNILTELVWHLLHAGITDFNTTAAYAKMRDNAVNPNQPKDARGELDVYMAYGYIPLEDDERGTCVRQLAQRFSCSTFSAAH